MDKTVSIVFLIQLVTTLVLVGVIWFVQVIHYPLYRKIKEGFVQYERSHLRRMACFAGPLMFIEAGTAIMLIPMVSAGMLTSLAIVNLVLLVLIWLSTILFSIGQHQQLSVHFSSKTLRALIGCNSIRLVLWTVKGGVLISMVWRLV